MIKSFLQKLSPYFRLMRFHKPIGILLLLWPTLWALWIAAGGVPEIKYLVIFVLGVVVMRAAGCVINDIADRRWDDKVHRTQNRPLVTGEISLGAAILLLIGLAGFALILVCQLNRLTIELAFMAALAAGIYPFLKRVTHLPQLGLGVAFSFGIPMAFAAETGSIPGVAWWLFGIAALWVIAYDTQYAMADRAEDRLGGIKSMAILFARHDRLIIGLLQLTGWGLFLGLAYELTLSVWVYLGLISALLSLIYQQFLIFRSEPQRCLQAFSNNQWVGFAVFSGIVLHFALH